MTATGRELIIALRAEVEIALHVRRAGWAPRDLRLAQQKVEHRADPPRHHQANRDPETRAHRPPRSVLAHVAHQQKVESGQQPPGEIEVDAESDRRRMMPGRHHQPDIVLHQHKGGGGNHNGPHRNHACININGNGFRISHRQSLSQRAFHEIKQGLTL